MGEELGRGAERVIAAPAGFVVRRQGPALVVLAEEIVAPAFAAGLDRPWEHVRPRPEGPGTGRGPRVLTPTPGGPTLLVKQHLRGGALSHFNRDRYFLLGRFLRELAVGRAARAAGIPVGEALGLVLVRARPGWRAWGMSRGIENAQDLAQWLATSPATDVVPLWRAAMLLADQLQGAGLEHRDFNLGNILVRRAPDRGWAPFVVDLDRARWWGAPLPARRRRRMVARLARSWRKVLGTSPPVE